MSATARRAASIETSTDVRAVRVRHHLPGRTRLAFAGGAAPAIGSLRPALEANGARLLDVNARAGSLLVGHDPALSADALCAVVAAALARGAAAPAPDARDADRLAAIAGASTPCVYAMTGTTPAGLPPDEAAKRLAAQGANLAPHPAGRRRLDIVAGQVATLPVALLVGSAVLSLATGGILDAVVTVAVVVANAAIGTASESATEALIRRLSRPVEHEATVVRGGATLRVPARDVVVGDLVALAPGSIVPADARIVAAADLSIDESALTGESMPALKCSAPQPAGPVVDRRNVAHAGTVVTGGDGRAVVFRTGAATEMALTRAMIGTARPPRPAIEEKLDRLATGLTLAALGASALILAVGLLRGEALASLLKTVVALAVSAIPEGLPTVSTTALALGARAMERDGALVRTLPSVEAVGAVDTICLDKTGTLTENRMAVVAAVTATRTWDGQHGWGDGDGDLRALAAGVALCNEASLSRGVGSATETALLHFAEAIGIDQHALHVASPITARQSRNERRRWMATEHTVDGRAAVAVKGAPDELVRLAASEWAGGGALPLTEMRRQELLAANAALAGRGFRVLAVARRDGILEDGLAGLVLLGLVALADPVRAEAREAIATFHRAGIRTIMITGDQAATAVAVARALDLSRSGILGVAEGVDIAGLDDAALAAVARRTSIFARVGPGDKLRIVQALQHAGHRVAMIGDGVNDGPALRAAAVGVAMGRRGTDVAREVADIVIAHDDLRELARAIARGRATEDNVRAAIRYMLSTNLSELIVMLGESLHGRGELESPLELLWLNLVTDVMPALGLAVAEPRGDVMQRAPWPAAEALFARGEGSGIGLDAAGLAAAALAVHFALMGRAGMGPRARSGTFLTLALGQIAHAFVLRDRSPGGGRNLAVSQRRLDAMVAAAAGLLALPFLAPGLGRVLGIARPPVGDAALALSAAAIATAVAELRRLRRPAGAAEVQGMPPGSTG